MASKKTKAAPAAEEDLDSMFADLGADVAPSKPTTKSAKKAAPTNNKEADDLLADLENLGSNPAPVSRPHTPRIQKETALKSSPKARAAAETSQTTSTRTSEEKSNPPRKSGDSTRSFHTSFTPSATSSDLQEAEKKSPIAQPAAPAPSTGGWGGWLVSAASAAVKQAEAAVKEIQQNEEAKRWAEQVKGNVGALRGLGGELSSRALPTFTNILHTLAPPISSHERLQIHITHDLIGYPSLDPMIYTTFSRVMSQVEGGDLLVLQRGSESTARQASDAGYRGGSAGWNDGPWWRQGGAHRDLGCVKGLVEGTKLVRVSAESYSSEYYTSHGGLELAVQRATEDLSESNPTRSSDIFLAVQAIINDSDTNLFQGPAKDKSADSVVEDESAEELVTFAIYLYDPVHNITFSTLSQTIPSKWTKWLDAPSPMTPASSSSPSTETRQSSNYFDTPNLPEEIAEIIENGGVDPREWVAEWIEEVLATSMGIVAQRYVARRMGVGEGGLGRGKARAEEVVEDNGGEAARAGIF